MNSLMITLIKNNQLHTAKLNQPTLFAANSSITTQQYWTETGIAIGLAVIVIALIIAIIVIWITNKKKLQQIGIESVDDINDVELALNNNDNSTLNYQNFLTILECSNKRNQILNHNNNCDATNHTTKNCWCCATNFDDDYLNHENNSLKENSTQLNSNTSKLITQPTFEIKNSINLNNDNNEIVSNNNKIVSNPILNNKKDQQLIQAIRDYLTTYVKVEDNLNLRDVTKYFLCKAKNNLPNIICLNLKHLHNFLCLNKNVICLIHPFNNLKKDVLIYDLSLQKIVGYTRIIETLTINKDNLFNLIQEFCILDEKEFNNLYQNQEDAHLLFCDKTIRFVHPIDPQEINPNYIFSIKSK